MKTYNTVYFLLFVLLIMGAFASMAQNTYGLKLLGVVSAFFGLLFLFQLYGHQVRPGTKDRLLQIELSSLIVLSFIFAFRIFNIHSQFTEMLFVAAGIILAGVFLRKLTTSYVKLRQGNPLFALMIATFYVSLIMFIIFIITAMYSPMISGITGIIGFILMLIFLVAALIKSQFMVDGEYITPFKWIIGKKDSSGLLISLFSMAALYFALNALGILPQLYVDDLPQAYYKLVNETRSDSGGQPNEKTKHDQFKEAYDKFVTRNILNRP